MSGSFFARASKPVGTSVTDCVKTPEHTPRRYAPPLLPEGNSISRSLGKRGAEGRGVLACSAQSVVREVRLFRRTAFTGDDGFGRWKRGIRRDFRWADRSVGSDMNTGWFRAMAWGF